MTKSAIYYTENTLAPEIMLPCQRQLAKISYKLQMPIVSVSLKPMNFGKNIVLPLERGYETMFRQILTALEASEGEIIYFCEHDVLYDKSHFDFIPPTKDRYYYNTNVWWLRYEDGHTLWVDGKEQVSGLCAYRELLIKHYKERIRRIEIEGFERRNGFEPGKHISHGGYDNCGKSTWMSKYPNIDIRHNSNLSNRTDDPKFKARWLDWKWKKEDYKNEKYTCGWTEGDESLIPNWNIKKGQFKQFLSSI
jgi:hypothetical protein